jgi:hypothetical protein
MLTGASDAALYSDWYDHIYDDETRDAYSYLVGLAASLRRYKCHPGKHGDVKDFRFKDAANRRPFDFIVNKGSLLFYFRRPAIESGRYSIEQLKAAGFTPEEEDNSLGEWRVRLDSIADVKRLWPILDLS